MRAGSRVQRSDQTCVRVSGASLHAKPRCTGKGATMAGESFGKREREKKQRERAEAKRQQRAQRADRVDPPEELDTEALMDRFRVLSEAFASGATDRETYKAERRAIFSALGLTDTLDDA